MKLIRELIFSDLNKCFRIRSRENLKMLKTSLSENFGKIKITPIPNQYKSLNLQLDHIAHIKDR